MEKAVKLNVTRVVEMASDETFDPEELMAGWKKGPEWNVAREW